MRKDGECMKVGDDVVFTGHGTRRSRLYNYPAVFGDKHHRVKAIKISCCNTFLIFVGIDGMYNKDYFTTVKTMTGNSQAKTGEA